MSCSHSDVLRTSQSRQCSERRSLFSPSLFQKGRTAPSAATHACIGMLRFPQESVSTGHSDPFWEESSGVRSHYRFFPTASTCMWTHQPVHPRRTCTTAHTNGLVESNTATRITALPESFSLLAVTAPRSCICSALCSLLSAICYLLDHPNHIPLLAHPETDSSRSIDNPGSRYSRRGS
jgi:hypothetical protein